MIIRWSEPNREVTRADIRAYREDYRERRDPSNWDDGDDDMISPERPVADVFPAISGVRIGRDGRIWVRNTTGPGKIVDGSHLVLTAISLSHDPAPRRCLGIRCRLCAPAPSVRAWGPNCSDA